MPKCLQCGTLVQQYLKTNDMEVNGLPLIIYGHTKNDFSENDKVRNLLKARKSAELKGGRMKIQ